jgi:hypothetical protein
MIPPWWDISDLRFAPPRRGFGKARRRQIIQSIIMIIRKILNPRSSAYALSPNAGRKGGDKK